MSCFCYSYSHSNNILLLNRNVVCVRISREQLGQGWVSLPYGRPNRHLMIINPYWHPVIRKKMSFGYLALFWSCTSCLIIWAFLSDLGYFSVFTHNKMATVRKGKVTIHKVPLLKSKHITYLLAGHSENWIKYCSYFFSHIFIQPTDTVNFMLCIKALWNPKFQMFLDDFDCIKSLTWVHGKCKILW